MPIKHRLIPFAILVALMLVPSAGAAVVPSFTVDGPSSDIVAMGGLAVAADSTGAVVYVKNAGGATHVFCATLSGGFWSAPQQVDPGLGGGGQPQVAVADNGRVAIVWVSNGQLYGAVRSGPGGSFSAPQAIDPALGDLSLAMGVSGTAYVSWTAADNGGTDVDVARLDLYSTSFVPLASALNSAPTVGAGVGALRSAVSVAADATGIVAWGEMGSDGRTHVLVRRVFGLNESAVTVDATLAQLEGRAGHSADTPVVGMPDDSDYPVIAFRQTFDDGGGGEVSRVVTEDLIGTQPQTPATVDSLAFPAPGGAVSPALAVDGTGDGLIASVLANNDVVGASTTPSGWTAGETLDPFPDTLAPTPSVALGRDQRGVVAWQSDPNTVDAQLYDDGTPSQLAQMSRAELGPIGTGPVSAAQDNLGDSFVAFVQGAPARVVVGASVPKPGSTHLMAVASSHRSQIVLSWTPARDAFSAIEYQVMLDKRLVATTHATHLRLPMSLRPGAYHWQVIAIDGFGQQRPSSSGTFKVK